MGIEGNVPERQGGQVGKCTNDRFQNEIAIPERQVAHLGELNLG